MNKFQKFAALRAMALTKEEAEEYFACKIGEDSVSKLRKNSEEKINLNRIMTSLMLVYVKEARVEFLSYLDLDRVSELWGIKVSSFVYCKNNNTLPFASWYDVVESLKKQNVASLPQVLPSADDFVDAYSYKSHFQEVITLLRTKGISADYWEEGWYCTRDTYSDGEKDLNEEYFSFGMHNGECDIVSKEDIPSFIRVGFKVEDE